MPALLYALLTAPTPPVQHVPGWIKWLAELSGGEATGLAVGGMIATVVAIVGGVVRGFRKKQAEATAAADKPVAPMPPALPPPAPTALPVPHHYEVDLQATRVKQLHLESELVEAQEGMRRIRRALDDSALEQAQLSKALYAERAANEELRAKSAALLQEMARLRAEGSSERALRSVPPPRGRRER